jgi:Pycsar effector protein
MATASEEIAMVNEQTAGSGQAEKKGEEEKHPAKTAIAHSGAEPLKFKFLQLQVTYFMTHLTLADAKAAGIIAYVGVAAGVTADKISLEPWPYLSIASIAAIGAIVFSVVTGAFAFAAIWPRRTSSSAAASTNSFSWLSVASQSLNGGVGSHYRELSRSPDESVLRPIADVAEELAAIIKRKYEQVRIAFIWIVPATMLHVAFWILR